MKIIRIHRHNNKVGYTDMRFVITHHSVHYEVYFKRKDGCEFRSRKYLNYPNAFKRYNRFIQRGG